MERSTQAGLVLFDFKVYTALINLFKKFKLIFPAFPFYTPYFKTKRFGIFFSGYAMVTLGRNVLLPGFYTDFSMYRLG